jgi:hypothetical protein
MNKVLSTLITAVAALALSGVTYAQSNDTLATPNIMSSAANATNGYGTPGAANSDSGMRAASPNSRPQSTNNSSTSGTVAFGVNNTLARPSVVSPVARK